MPPPAIPTTRFKRAKLTSTSPRLSMGAAEKAAARIRFKPWFLVHKVFEGFPQPWVCKLLTKGREAFTPFSLSSRAAELHPPAKSPNQQSMCRAPDACNLAHLRNECPKYFPPWTQAVERSQSRS